MYTGLEHKFRQNKDLGKMLVDTKDMKLVEHTQKDKFWGDGGNGNGLNKLGILLMKVRKELFIEMIKPL